MGPLQILTGNACKQAIELAIVNDLPVNITVRRQNRWITYRSRVIVEFNGYLWLDYPTLDSEQATCDFPENEKLGVTFRLSHRKYIFAVTCLGTEEYEPEEGVKASALKVLGPDSMQRVERRMQERVPIPSGQVGRAAFWLGGQDAQPTDATANAPVWSGKIINLSTGGVCIRTTCEAAKYIERGDVVGIRLTFGAGQREIVIDAQFRHAEPDGSMALLGFQFVDSDQSDRAKAAREAVRKKVGELQND